MPTRVVEVNAGVRRVFCPDCGSPLAAWFDYLPGQVYLPLGILDQAAELPPEIHSHSDAQLPWLKIEDGLERAANSSACRLRQAALCG